MLDAQYIPGLPNAAQAVREFIGTEQITRTGASMVASEALKAATGPIIAAAFADMSDDMAALGLDDAAHYLDLVSHQLRGAP